MRLFQLPPRHFARLGPRVLSARQPHLLLPRRDDREGVCPSRRGAYGFHIYRHTQRHPLRAGDDGLGQGIRRGHREAHDLHARTGEAAQAEGHADGPHPRPHADLLGLSRRQGGPRALRQGGVRHRAQDIRRVPAGVAHNAHRAQPREQRCMAYRPPSVRARRDAWAT